MGIKDFLNKFKGNNKLTKSNTGDIITLDEKRAQDEQEAENLKIENEKKERKVNQDIRESLSLLNNSHKENNKSQLKQSAQSNNTNQPKAKSHNINNAENIDVPLTNYNPRTQESDDLDNYVKESTTLLDDSDKKHSINKSNIKQTKNQQVSKKEATGFDMDR